MKGGKNPSGEKRESNRACFGRICSSEGGLIRGRDEKKKGTH